MLWALAGIFALGALIAFVEMPALLQDKRKKDIWMFILLLGAGFAMNAALLLDLKMPTPLKWIMAVFEPFGNAIVSMIS